MPKKLTLKKANRSKSKLGGIISKEYKEDLVDGYNIIKAKVGHSNSFETKIKNLHTLSAPINQKCNIF